ncbi:ABC transporter ATP-binding protein [Paracoccus fontiphilus]|uniref:ABC transporter ATP-binding protein n=1 Tax=Paracoccus fontiphilus TaxID=1815556 RepID=A0ABV7IIA8_9RHOB
MIVLRDLTKIYRLGGHMKVVANGIDAIFPTGVSVGLLGRNGAGKSTLLKMIAGTVHPTRGQVLSDGQVSFPVGLASSLHPDLTGAQNTRFVARIYGADTTELMHWVEDFAELGEHFHLPVRTYSSGMRGRLSFGINMGIDFDTYLVDEVTAVGDADFKRKSRDVFLNRIKKSGAIYVSHSMGMLRELCQSGAVLEAGNLHFYDDVQDAIDHYNHTLDPERVHASAALPGGSGAADFPYDARMLYGLGLPQTASDWLGDCLRRHRACHFARIRELHYFDVRAGQGTATLLRRQKSARDLAMRLGRGSGPEQRNTLRLLGELGEVLALHAAPPEGHDRHATYVDFMTSRRRGQPLICDFTPSYALLPEQELAEMAALGAGRFVVVLRDPLTRLWAQIQAGVPARVPASGSDAQIPANASRAPARGQEEGAGEEDARMTRITAIVRRAAARGPQALARTWPEADYSGMFDRLDRVVASDRIVILFHEELHGRDGIDKLTGILDIPPLPESSLPPLGPPEDLPPCPREIRDMLMALLKPQYEAMRERFGAQLPSQWSEE